MTRKTSPIVSTDWLKEHSEDSDLRILDIREPENYKTSHIPNAINVPFSDLSRGGELSLELPYKNDLFETLGSAGVDEDSRVVVVNNADGKYPLADMTRIAFTLIYGGVREVSVLDGGIEKWEKEERPISETVEEPEKKQTYEGKIHEEIIVSKEYVENKIGEVPIIDARTPEAYFGVIQEPYTFKPGHIPTAKSLPAPWYWTEEGTYRSTEEIKEMVESVVSEKSEIIVYCGVGGFGSAAWFVFHELLGYDNVRLFEGSAKEWTSDPDAPVIKYKWE